MSRPARDHRSGPDERRPAPVAGGPGRPRSSRPRSGSEPLPEFGPAAEHVAHRSGVCSARMSTVRDPRASRCAYGSPRIPRHLASSRRRVSRKRVERLMRRPGCRVRYCAGSGARARPGGISRRRRRRTWSTVTSPRRRRTGSRWRGRRPHPGSPGAGQRSRTCPRCPSRAGSSRCRAPLGHRREARPAGLPIRARRGRPMGRGGRGSAARAARRGTVTGVGVGSVVGSASRPSCAHVGVASAGVVHHGAAQPFRARSTQPPPPAGSPDPLTGHPSGVGHRSPGWTVPSKRPSGSATIA